MRAAQGFTLAEGKLFGQLVFSTEMENSIMEGIEEKRQDASVAATEYLKAHPEPIAAWLDGVTTRTGEPGLPAVRKALKLN